MRPFVDFELKRPPSGWIDDARPLVSTPLPRPASGPVSSRPSQSSHVTGLRCPNAEPNGGNDQGFCGFRRGSEVVQRLSPSATSLGTKSGRAVEPSLQRNPRESMEIAASADRRGSGRQERAQTGRPARQPSSFAKATGGRTASPATNAVSGRDRTWHGPTVDAWFVASPICWLAASRGFSRHDR